MFVFSFNQCCGIIICANVFIDWNCFSGERFGQWISCYVYFDVEINHAIVYNVRRFYVFILYPTHIVKINWNSIISNSVVA